MYSKILINKPWELYSYYEDSPNYYTSEASLKNLPDYEAAGGSVLQKFYSVLKAWKEKPYKLSSLSHYSFNSDIMQHTSPFWY